MRPHVSDHAIARLRERVPEAADIDRGAAARMILDACLVGVPWGRSSSAGHHVFVSLCGRSMILGLKRDEASGRDVVVTILTPDQARANAQATVPKRIRDKVDGFVRRRLRA